MKRSTISLLSLCIGTLALAASAADDATEKAADKTDKKSKVVIRGATAAEEARIPAGYTLIKKNGLEYFCRTEKVTGSRTQTKQICQTKEQMDAERNNSNNTVEFAAGR